MESSEGRFSTDVPSDETELLGEAVLEATADMLVLDGPTELCTDDAAIFLFLILIFCRSKSLYVRICHKQPRTKKLVKKAPTEPTY